ncbi:hypothetical protein GC105_13105 [Alkalibaculum sp. M08DMB]|uniref:WD40 repeat domain-containing protein n=1 Tax=Alkalibaculum sporogenes TaxID=2655001 RepID=A0A6A7KBK1_9FIRM|nr:hypothetical protein [Alkalibaculum sporogenes]
MICEINNFSDTNIALICLDSGEVKKLMSLENCVIRQIQFNSTTQEYLFEVFDRNGLEHEDNCVDTTYILKWKYPFEENKPQKITSLFIKEWSVTKLSNWNDKYALYDDTTATQQKLVITDQNLSERIGMYISEGNKGYFCRINWSSDDKYIALTYSEVVEIIRVEDCICIRQIKIDFAMATVFSPDGIYFAIEAMSKVYLFKTSDLI